MRKSKIQTLLEKAAADIHGVAYLAYDGDCFDPPPWRCHLSWLTVCKATGRGNTPEVAIRRAMLAKAKQKIEIRKNPKKHGFVSVKELAGLLKLKKGKKRP